jgi:hypothetical protein
MHSQMIAVLIREDSSYDNCLFHRSAEPVDGDFRQTVSIRERKIRTHDRQNEKADAMRTKLVFE